MAQLTSEDLEIVKTLPLFAGLPGETVHTLLGAARFHDYERGTNLFIQGEPADRFYVIFSGWVKLSRETVDGDEYVIGIFRRGESFAEAAIFDSGRFPVNADVVEAAHLLVVPAKPFIAALMADGTLALNMLAAMSQHLRSLVMQLEQLQAKSAPQRLGSFLLRLNPDLDGATTIHLPYDKSLIAARLGMKPETFSRALAKLRSLGVRSDGGDIVVSEPAALQRFCEESDEA